MVCVANKGATVRVTNLAGLPGIVLVLAQKVPHPGNPLSSGQPGPSVTLIRQTSLTRILTLPCITRLRREQMWLLEAQEGCPTHLAPLALGQRPRERQKEGYYHFSFCTSSPHPTKIWLSCGMKADFSSLRALSRLYLLPGPPYFPSCP